MAKRPAPESAGKPLDASVRIAVLHGKELHFQIEFTHQLRDALKATHGDVDVIYFDGATTPAATFLDECRTFGLMQQPKLVVVDRADKALSSGGENEGEDDEGGGARPQVERYAANPCDNATLVLRCEIWRKGKLDGMIEKVGVLLKCDAPSEADAVRWAVQNCPRRHNATLDATVAEALVERLGPDLARIDQELEKLATHVGADSPGTKGTRPKAITAAAVGDLVGLTREEEAWGLQETLLSGDAPAVLRHLRVILDNARRDAHIPVSYACVDLARKLHGAASGLRQGMNPWQLAGKLKLWPESRRDAVLKAASAVDPRRSASLLHAAVRADAGIKSGSDPTRTLELLALEFTALSASGRG